MSTVTILRMERREDDLPPEIVQICEDGRLEDDAFGVFVGQFLSQCVYRPNNCLTIILEGIIDELGSHQLEAEGTTFGAYLGLRRAIQRAFDDGCGESFAAEAEKLLKNLPNVATAPNGTVDDDQQL